jgi:hypothetical protein
MSFPLISGGVPTVSFLPQAIIPIGYFHNTAAVLLGRFLSGAYKRLELFWVYTRHTSSCLGVASAHAAESHSVSMLIDGLSLAPTSNSNYFGYKTDIPIT